MIQTTSSLILMYKYFCIVIQILLASGQSCYDRGTNVFSQMTKSHKYKFKAVYIQVLDAIVKLLCLFCRMP